MTADTRADLVELLASRFGLDAGPLIAALDARYLTTKEPHRCSTNADEPCESAIGCPVHPKEYQVALASSLTSATKAMLDGAGLTPTTPAHCEEHRPQDQPRVAGERHEHRPGSAGDDARRLRGATDPVVVATPPAAPSATEATFAPGARVLYSPSLGGEEYAATVDGEPWRVGPAWVVALRDLEPAYAMDHHPGTARTTVAAAELNHLRPMPHPAAPDGQGEIARLDLLRERARADAAELRVEELSLRMTRELEDARRYHADAAARIDKLTEERDAAIARAEAAEKQVSDLETAGRQERGDWAAAAVALGLAHYEPGTIAGAIRAEVDGFSAARTALANVSGALCDSGAVVPADEWRYGEAVRGIVAERDAARAAFSAVAAAVGIDRLTYADNAAEVVRRITDLRGMTGAATADLEDVRRERDEAHDRLRAVQAAVEGAGRCGETGCTAVPTCELRRASDATPPEPAKPCTRCHRDAAPGYPLAGGLCVSCAADGGMEEGGPAPETPPEERWGVWNCHAGCWASWGDHARRVFASRVAAGDIARKWNEAEHIERWEARPMPPEAKPEERWGAYNTLRDRFVGTRAGPLVWRSRAEVEAWARTAVPRQYVIEARQLPPDADGGKGA